MKRLPEYGSCPEYRELTRRSFLRSVGIGVAALGLPCLPRVAFASSVSTRDVMVSIYLRGGADGLTLCVPYAEANYYAIRPTIAVPPPGGGSNAAIDLNGFFGLPPAMAPLKLPFQDGNLAVVHAIGQANWTRSHFDAQRWMESAGRDPSATTGWLGRHIAGVSEMNPGSLLRGISMTNGMALTMGGGLKTLPVSDPDHFGFNAGFYNQAELTSMLQLAYQGMHDMTKQVLQDTVNTVTMLDGIDFVHYQPSGGAAYTDASRDNFGPALKAAAALIKADVGVEAVHIDINDWDTHADQGPIGGRMEFLMQTLSLNLAAFYKDMFTDNRTRWTMAVVSEFGRNAIENGSKGTDHGAGNCLFVMGGSVNGGQVYANWPGLRSDQLLDGVDLQMTMDFRDVLSEIVQKRLQNSDLATVFPGYTPQFHNIVRP